ncbi:MAG TPA: hypothetical protein VLL54_06315 [Pyrinomonadaceae bacterium]|nr:hypothetical protein [Pyrinomonadaceae bacterium]
MRKQRLGPTLLAILTLLGAGFVAGRARRPLPPPLTIERRSDSPLTDDKPAKSSAQPAITPTIIAEDVYICGARTKKGTPCSRRVHGPVRCWQHKGMPAMMAQEKLRVKE